MSAHLNCLIIAIRAIIEYLDLNCRNKKTASDSESHLFFRPPTNCDFREGHKGLGSFLGHLLLRPVTALSFPFQPKWFPFHGETSDGETSGGLPLWPN